MDIRDALVKDSLKTVMRVLMEHRMTRRLLLRRVESYLYRESLLDHRSTAGPVRARLDRMDCISGLLNGLDRIIDKGIVSRHVMQKMMDAFLGNVIINADARAIRRETGVEPPSFVTISPTGKCNLRCDGCYAADAALRGNSLSFEVFDRILQEKRELWGSHWTVVSGGEPFLWRDGDWDLVRLAARHPSDIFMIYTNGTLIDDELCRRMAEVGNITPAISVEGFKVQTDRRRGEGVHARILDAFDRLRKHGIPFGVSATATRDNWRAITCDDFAEFYFTTHGALYGWIFQYMPMGRGQRTDLVVPPEARVEMASRMWRLVRERKILMIDFWNSATVSMGCIAAARPGGYFHINWDGDIMPCVFTPYAAGNIHGLYASGGTLADVLSLPFFKKVQQWQSDYGFHTRAGDTGNWLCPCAIRDHSKTFFEAVVATAARPINEEAKLALADPAYARAMLEYGQEMAALTDRHWQEHYVGPEQGSMTGIPTSPSGDASSPLGRT